MDVTYMKKCIFGLILLLVAGGLNAQYKARVDDLLCKMTLEEKVGQMAQVTVDLMMDPITWKPDMDKVRKGIIDYRIGSVLNTWNNTARSKEDWHGLISMLQEQTQYTRLKIPLVYGVDVIHGGTYTLESTLFPQQIAQAASFNRQLVRRAAEIAAYEARAASIPWTFSPVLDLGLDARWPRQWETFGEDPFLASELATAITLGYQGDDPDQIGSHHIMACAKHFMGYSSPVSGKDRTPAIIAENVLREYHLPSFHAAIKAGVGSIMLNSGLINGEPVHASKFLLTDLLKEELQFEGVIITDWLDIENLFRRDKVAKSSKEAVRMAINAGVDMSMIPYNYDFCNYLVELVNEGAVPMQRIDDAVRRILTMKFKLNLFEQAATNPVDYPLFASTEHSSLAREAAAEAITLLENRNNVLPLAKNKKILVTGPNANTMRGLNGGWSYSWQGEKTNQYTGAYNSILEAIQQHPSAGKVSYAPGIRYKEKGKYWEEEEINIREVLKQARKADYIILCLGENSYCEKPGDLHNLSLSDLQLKLAGELAATGKPVILVLNEGRPRIISKIVDKMAAVVQTYLPGNYGGDALADVLFGDVNPSGRLPYTYPRYTNSLLNYWHKYSEEQVRSEGQYNYESDYSPQWEFGHGLSYSTFSYDQLQLSAKQITVDDTLTVSVRVTNTDDRLGKETVLLYLSDLYATLAPDMKRLKGFDKILLEPGESRVVQFRLTREHLSFVNLKNERVTEPGHFRLSIGNQQAEFELCESFIHIIDNRFIREGKPYYFIGANFWYGAILGSEGKGGDRERLLRELDFLQARGIDNLRVLVGADGRSHVPAKVEPTLQLAPGVYNDEIFDGLDYLLAEMDKRGMQAVLYFTNSWEWSGGYSQYLNWMGKGKNPIPAVDGWPAYMQYVQQYADCAGCHELLKQHITKVITRTNRYTGKRYVDDPAIFSWQIGNEPRAFSDSNKALFAAWIKDIAAHIKSLDSNHLVSVGSEGKHGCEQDIELFEEIHADENVDYLTMHIWPKNWGWLDTNNMQETLQLSIDNTAAYMDEHMQVARRLQKPIVMEEFGFPRDGHVYDRASGTTLRDSYYSSVSNQILSAAASGDVLAGCNIWAWGGEGLPSNLYWKQGDDYLGDPAQEEQGLNSVFSTDATVELMCQYNRTLRGDNVLVDQKATESTKELFRDLRDVMGKGILFGHQDDPAYGHSWYAEPGRSDVFETAGDYPALVGWEIGHVETTKALNIDSIPFVDMKRMIREVHESGGVNSISWHANNIAIGGSSWDCEQDTVVRSILPGEVHHLAYLGWLNKVADFLLDLKDVEGQPIPVILRLYHEHTGSWFWWGAKQSTPDEYIALWKMTVSHLRDTRGVHNLLYAYSPADPMSMEHFLSRYPGDEWVDIVGFDCYFQDNGSELSLQSYQKSMERGLQIVTNYANRTGKVAIMAETGLEGVSRTDFFTQILYPLLKPHKIAYVLLWRNAHDKPDHYYVPYKGHPAAADFKAFTGMPGIMLRNDWKLMKQ